MKNEELVKLLTDSCVEIGDVMFYLIISHVKTAQNLTLSHIKVLKLLEFKKGLKMKDISEKLSIAPGGATYIIDSLIKAHLVERYRVDEDRRIVYIRLTEEGHKKLDDLREAKRETWKQILADVPSQELGELMSGMGIVKKFALRIREKELT
ncbi:MAG: MarR family transcriptional regulator [Candidatus Eremiobacterota bacterium]